MQASSQAPCNREASRSRTSQPRIGDWMQTFTGLQFWPMDPRPEDITVMDIAHSLAHQCRFAGHCTRFYSVAEHSVIASLLVPEEDRKWALLHDATEAYLVDLPRPVKKHSAIGEHYKVAERRLMVAICQRFGLDPVEPASVKKADNVMLMTEKRDLMPNSPAKWAETEEPCKFTLPDWGPVRAKEMFLRRAEKLGVR